MYGFQPIWSSQFRSGLLPTLQASCSYPSLCPTANRPTPRTPRPKSPNHHLRFPRIIPRHNCLILGCTSCRLHQFKSIPRPNFHLPDSMPAPDRTVPIRSAPVTCVASASLDVPSISPVNPVFYVAFKVPTVTIKRKPTRMLRF